MEYYRVKGHENLIRDYDSNAILNTDMTEYNNYIKMRKIKENENARIENLENDLLSMKNDLNEIKNLLRNISNGS